MLIGKYANILKINSQLLSAEMELFSGGLSSMQKVE